MPRMPKLHIRNLVLRSETVEYSNSKPPWAPLMVPTEICSWNIPLSELPNSSCCDVATVCGKLRTLILSSTHFLKTPFSHSKTATNPACFSHRFCYCFLVGKVLEKPSFSHSKTATKTTVFVYRFRSCFFGGKVLEKPSFSHSKTARDIVDP